jgi:hypothetical protein
VGALDIDLINMVRAQIRAEASVANAIGTCVQRDNAGPGALVQFDPSSLAVPVKVLGNVVLRAGMRCTLTKYATEWIVTGAFAAPSLGYVNAFVFGPSTPETLTSAAFVDLTSIAPLSFTKYHDNTTLELTTSVAGYSTVASTTCRWGLRFTQTSGSIPYTPADQQLNYIYWSVANAHFFSTVTHPIAPIPAGDYSVQMRWKRTLGTGTVTTSSDDLYSITVREVIDPTDPYF